MAQRSGRRNGTVKDTRGTARSAHAAPGRVAGNPSWRSRERHTCWWKPAQGARNHVSPSACPSHKTATAPSARCSNGDSVPDGGVAGQSAGARQGVKQQRTARRHHDEPVSGRRQLLERMIGSFRLGRRSRQLPSGRRNVDPQLRVAAGRPLVPIDAHHTGPRPAAPCLTLAPAAEQGDQVCQRQSLAHPLNVRGAELTGTFLSEYDRVPESWLPPESNQGIIDRR